MLQVDNLRFSYPRAQVLDGISFSIAPGQMVSLLGPNGAGKTTLFRCILGLLRGWQGNIRVQGQNAQDISHARLAQMVAYIPQAHYPAFNYSVLQMVLMGTTPGLSLLKGPGASEMEKALAALQMLGIPQLRERDFTRLSGGEQQLVLIARAIAQDSRLLIMDEPTASLDFGNQVHVMRRVRALADRGYAILQATHNPNQSFQYSDTILALKGGRLLAQGSPREVFDAGLIHALYGVETDVESLQGDCIRICIPREI